MHDEAIFKTQHSTNREGDLKEKNKTKQPLIHIKHNERNLKTRTVLNLVHLSLLPEVSHTTFSITCNFSVANQLFICHFKPLCMGNSEKLVDSW